MIAFSSSSFDSNAQLAPELLISYSISVFDLAIQNQGACRIAASRAPC